jgi:AraC-like DNA-binding protein
MLLQKLSPYIRLASDSIIQAPWTLKERVIFDYELLYIMEGEVEVTIEDHLYHGIPGDIFLFRPKKAHSIKIKGDQQFRQPHIHFDLVYQDDSPNVRVSFKQLEKMDEKEMTLFRQDLIEYCSLSIANHIRPQNPLIIEKMIFDIIKEFEIKMPYYEIHMKGLFTQLFVHLIRENYWSQNPRLYSNMDTLYRIQTFLKHNVTRKVTLDELSDMFNISKYHLIRLFKKAFGMGPIQYHQLIRLEKVKEKIQFTDTPISTISDEFGFETTQSFSRFFKNIEGVPPTFYRRDNTQ